MTEQFANGASSTLNGAIDSAVLTLTVTSAAKFPFGGTFRILIDTEIMIVTAVAAAVFTVTRGAEGTAAAAHANGALVTCILTTGAIAQLTTDATGIAAADATAKVVAAAADATAKVVAAVNVQIVNDLRLTLSTGVPIPVTDVTGGVVYLTPYLSGSISLYDGTNWVTVTTAEVSIALSGLTTGKNYDVFAYLNAGVVTLELSAAWTNATTRANAVVRQNGVLVKSGTPTRRLIGTFTATAANATADTLLQRYVSNLTNRVARPLKVVEATDSWNLVNPNSVWRQARATASNRVDVVCCDETNLVSLTVMAMISTASAGTNAAVGVGIDSTTVNSADVFFGAATTTGTACTAFFKKYLAAGSHALNWLETALGSGQTYVFYGDNALPTLLSSGMVGEIWN